MKKLCLIALVSLSLNAGAQYFQHTYGNRDHEFLSSGVNTVAQGLGHFMSGHSRLTCVNPLSTVPVTFTDVDGNIPGAPYFNRNFILAKNGTIVHANQTFCFELDNGNGFGVVGSYTDMTQGGPGNSSAYYMQLDPSGYVISITEYNVPGFSVGVNGICESSPILGDDLYITGAASDYTFVYSYVLKININTGAIIWSNVFDILPSVVESGRGVCQSPYMPYGTAEIVVVGDVTDQSTSPSQTDAYLVHLDAVTGIVLAPANIYGTNANHDMFSSIRVANNTAAGPAGFIIGGNTIAHTDFNAWVVNTDPSGNVNWSSAFDITPNTGDYNICSDVIERFNTNGQWEYYAVGTADISPLPPADYEVHVLKIDENGNGVAGGEFLYGSAGNIEMGFMADQYNTSGTLPPDGLSIYSTRHGGIYADMQHIKAYFNGVSGCNEQFNNPTQLNAPGQLGALPVSTVTWFNTGTIEAAFVPMRDNTLCYSPSIATGSNARVAPAEDKSKDRAVTILPNPAETGTKTITIETESDKVCDAEITIVDMLGKQYYAGKTQLVKGKNSLPVDIQSIGMAPGIYTVTIRTADNLQNNLLLVK